MSIDVMVNNLPETAINMANGNAGTVFRALGLSFDWEDCYAQWTPETVESAVLILLGMDSHAGRPEVRDGNFIQCGYTRADIAHRAVQMLELARQAKSLGEDVVAY